MFPYPIDIINIVPDFMVADRKKDKPNKRDQILIFPGWRKFAP